MLVASKGLSAQRERATIDEGAETVHSSAADPEVIMTEDRDQPTVPTQRRFVQVIDLWSGHPGEVERLLNRWRRDALAVEHIDNVSVCRDVSEEGHLVLQVEYPSWEVAAAGPDSGSEPVLGADEAATLVGLLDRAPRFRNVGV